MNACGTLRVPPLPLVFLRRGTLQSHTKGPPVRLRSLLDILTSCVLPSPLPSNAKQTPLCVPPGVPPLRNTRRREGIFYDNTKIPISLTCCQ